MTKKFVKCQKCGSIDKNVLGRYINNARGQIEFIPRHIGTSEIMKCADCCDTTGYAKLCRNCCPSKHRTEFVKES